MFVLSILATGSVAGFDSLTVGSNLLLGSIVGNCCGWDNSIVTNPTNPDYAFAAVSGYYYSTLDGGLSWSPQELHCFCGDDISAYDSGGTLYWSNVFTWGPTPSPTQGLRVDVSKDNGVSWETPSIIVAPIDIAKGLWPDKEWLSVDDSNSSFRGRVYLAWEVRAPGVWQGNTVSNRVERSVLSHSDNGFNFSTPLTIAGSDTGYPTPAVGPKGQLYIVYVQWESNGEASLQVRASYDGGVTFGAPSWLAYYSGIPWKLSNTKIRILSIPYVAVDPMQGTIYVVWAQYDPSTNRSAIVITTSNDGGRTWSSSHRVSDNVSGNDEFFPAVAVGHDGVVHVAWLDRRNDPKNTAFDVYYSRSLDHGRTFEHNIRVSEQSSNPNSLQHPTFIGDYIGISVDAANRVHLAWNGVGPSRIAATYTATIYQSQTTAQMSTSSFTSEGSSHTTMSETTTAATSSSTMMTPLQTESSSASNATSAVATLGGVLLLAISIVVVKRKRTSKT